MRGRVDRDISLHAAVQEEIETDRYYALVCVCNIFGLWQLCPYASGKSDSRGKCAALVEIITKKIFKKILVFLNYVRKTNENHLVIDSLQRLFQTIFYYYFWEERWIFFWFYQIDSIISCQRKKKDKFSAKKYKSVLCFFLWSYKYEISIKSSIKLRIINCLMEICLYSYSDYIPECFLHNSWTKNLYTFKLWRRK